MKKKHLKPFIILALGTFALIIITVSTLYLSLHEKLPDGKTGVDANNFALKIQQAIKYDKYLETDYLQWTFRNKNHYVWDRQRNVVEVQFDNHKVFLDLDHPEKSKTQHLEHFSRKTIKKALDNFNNDSFWVVAPNKLFDKGTIRKLVTLEDKSKALLITYQSGGTTPGDSYLWKVDKNYRPVSYKMWVSMFPIGGIEATWEDWVKTESGAYFSQQHKLLGFGIPITNLKAWKAQ